MQRNRKSILSLIVVSSCAAGYALGSATGASLGVWRADEAFNRALAERNRVAFSSWIAEDAVFLGGGRLDGRDAIVEEWSVFLDPASGRRLSWQPHTAVESRCQDLGYTLGDYVSLGPGPDGEPQLLGGTYVTIWRKGGDGAWRAVADAGTPPAPQP
jgi:ketosteroid isomerase-like protein